MELKFADVAETELEGLLAPHGGPFNGRDIQGEFFSAKTDFALDWFAERPLIYQHGLDDKTGLAVVGRIKALSRDDLGLWMKAQLDAAGEYYAAIRELVKAGKLALSSGSMRHLVQVSKAGEILRWPLIEGSLTPTPANPFAEVQFTAAKAHFQSIGLDVPDYLDGGKAIAEVATLLAERTKDLQQRRQSEGRQLSEQNRAAIRCAVRDLQCLLDSDRPERTKDGLAARRLQASTLARYYKTIAD